MHHPSHPGSGPAGATRHSLPCSPSHIPGSEDRMCIPIPHRSIRSTTSSFSSSSSFYAPSASSSTKVFTSSIPSYHDLRRTRDARNLSGPTGVSGEMIYPAAEASNNITHSPCSSTDMPENQRQYQQPKTRPSLAGLKRNMSTRFGSAWHGDRSNENESSRGNDKRREKAKEKEEIQQLENKLLQQLNMRIMKEEEEKEGDVHGGITSGGPSGSMDRARNLRRKQYEEMFGLGSGGDDGVNEVRGVSSRNPVKKESKKPLNRQKTQKYADENRVVSIGGRPKEWRQRSYEEAFGENASEGKAY